MKTIRLVLAVAFILCFVSSLSLAQGTSCQADFEKFCAGVDEDQSGQLTQCLRRHEDKLSPACQEDIAWYTGGRSKGFVKACQADADKYCKSVSRKAQRLILVCLYPKVMANNLSPECTAYFNKYLQNYVPEIEKEQ